MELDVYLLWSRSFFFFIHLFSVFDFFKSFLSLSLMWTWMTLVGFSSKHGKIRF